MLHSTSLGYVFLCIRVAWGESSRAGRSEWFECLLYGISVNRCCWSVNVLMIICWSQKYVVRELTVINKDVTQNGIQ